MYRFKVGKANLGYNFTDAQALERFEKAFKALHDAQENIPKEASGSAQIRYVCTTVFDLFNTIFGAGTAEKVFGDTCDMEVCLEAVRQLVEARSAADIASGNRIKALTDKYKAKL